MTTLTLARDRPLVAVPLRHWLVQAIRTVLVWQERSRSRHQLSGLNDRLLQDIGLDRATASRELDKRFWQS